MESEKFIAMRYAALAPALVKNLQNRGFEAYFCATVADARAKVLSLIPDGASVAWGGSLSLEESGVISALKNGNYRLIDRDSAKDPAERAALMRQAFFSDTYLSSVNAISENGVMVNIDGNCNRIAAIAYGPGSVILLVGLNKLCRDAAAARERAQSFVAPANGFRLNAQLPCVKTGFCHDCLSPQCMCAQVVEMRCNRIAGRIKVVLCGESLGI